MPRAYTIRDVARKARVGVGTVSRVLNNSPLVSEATRQKVLNVIDEMDFHPSPLARHLSIGKTLAIGVIVPFFTRPVFVGRLEGIEAVLAQSDYDLILYNVETPEQRNKIFRTVPRERRVDGLIIIALRPSDSDVEHFQRSGIPVILVDTQHPALTSIRIDDVDGGRQATQFLVDLGHRRIAYVSDRLDNPFGFEASARRLEGHQAVLAENEIAIETEYHREGEYGRHTTSRVTEELLSLEEPPTAIFAASDTQALGIIESLQQTGLSVPEDVSVVGYDDIEVATYTGLTTVHQPLYQCGVESMNALLGLLNNGADSASLSSTLPVSLVARATTAPPVG